MFLDTKLWWQPTNHDHQTPSPASLTPQPPGATQARYYGTSRATHGSDTFWWTPPSPCTHPTPAQLQKGCRWLPAAFPSPHCRPAQGSGWCHSRRARSRCRWPASRCGVRSGRRSAQPRQAGSGTAPWPPRSGSSLRCRSPPALCPGSCRHTLQEEVAAWVCVWHSTMTRTPRPSLGLKMEISTFRAAAPA